MSSNVVSLNQGVTVYSGRQLELIHNTIAKGLTPAEFDLFMTLAQHTGLDPFRKQIYPLLFSADDPKKRRVVNITSIDGLRAIAFRSRRYRPDDDEPDFSYEADLKGPANPLGLVRAKVCVFIRDDGRDDWRRVPGVAYWDEFAPIKEDVEGGFDWVDTGETWADTGKPKKRKVPRVEGATVIPQLDTSGNWGKMPRLMLAKCAEAQALRKAFPEDLSSLYEASEFDRSETIDLSPSEYLEVQRTEDRLDKIGARGAITFQLSPTSPLEPIGLGQIADRVLAAYREFDLQQARWFESANRSSLQEFWARAKADALGLKAEMDKLRGKLEPPAGDGAA